MQEYFAAIEVERRGLMSVLTKPIYGLYGTRGAGKWDQVIVAFLGITGKDTDELLREICDQDFYLAAACIASGIKVLETTRRDLFPQIIADNGIYYTVSASANLLAEAGETLIAPYLITLLGHHNYHRVGNGASNALLQLGKPAVPYLIQGLDNSRSEIRARCAGIMGAIGDERAVPALIRRLSDQGWDGWGRPSLVCQVAASSLNGIGGSEALNAAQTWKDDVLAQFFMLGGRASREIRWCILTFLDYQDSKFQQALLNDFGKTQVQDLISILEGISSPRYATPVEKAEQFDFAVRIIGALRSTGAVGELARISYLEGFEDIAINTLKQIGTPEAIAAMARG